VGPRIWSGRGGEEKILSLPGLEILPARSQSLYRLSYPGSLTDVHGLIILGREYK
jgi:hypothetical protein